MTGEFRLDPDVVRERAARLAALADRVAQTYTGLRGAVDQAAGSWGDDHMGRAFADQFTPHAEQVLAGVQEMTKGLASTADGILGIADEFEARDFGNAAWVNPVSAEQGPGAETATGRQQVDATAALSPVDTPTSVPSDLATTTPDTVSGTPFTNPSGEVPRAAQPASGGTQPSDGTPGRTGPDDGRRPRSPWNRSRPDASAPDGRRAGSPPAPPRPGSVLPPPERRDTHRSPGAPTRAGAMPPGRETPWNEKHSTTPGTPGRPGTPAKAGASPQQEAAPPRPHTPVAKDRRERDRPGTRENRDKGASDPIIGRLARQLAERHGVQVTGFDTPGLQPATIRNFVAAVDRVLTDYPMIELDIVAVDELDGDAARVRWQGEVPGERATTAMTLDRSTAQDPEASAPTTRSDETEQPELPVQPDVYEASLREFARALDAAGGGAARAKAQRVLIAEYLNLHPEPGSNLAEVVRGYREWRAELTGNDSAPEEFDIDEALGIAFAEVVRHGADASTQAKTLHAALVAAATPTT